MRISSYTETCSDIEILGARLRSKQCGTSCENLSGIFRAVVDCVVSAVVLFEVGFHILSDEGYSFLLVLLHLHALSLTS